MSHFLTGVILPKEVDEEDAEDAVERALAPYDENIEVAPYRTYIEGYGLERMRDHYKIETLAECAERVKDWSGRPGGIDEKGLYYLSRYNPASKWDWWEVGGRWDGALCRKGTNITSVAKAKLEACFALVPPDGEWIERGEMGWWAIVANEKSEAEWTEIVRDLAKRYADHLIVAVDCHI